MSDYAEFLATTDDMTEARQAIDAFMAELDKVPMGTTPVDIPDAFEKLRRALPAEADQDLTNAAEELAALVLKKVAQFRKMENIGVGEHTRPLVIVQTAGCRRALELALLGARVRSQDELDADAEVEAAAAEVTGLEAELADARKSLEAAVDAADLAAVTCLRPDVEVSLPGRIGDARLRLLDARIRLAEAAAVHPAGAAGTAREEVERLRQVYDEALEALQAARRTLDTGCINADRAAAEAQIAEEAVARLRADRDRIGSEHKAAQQARVRRLAGLELEAPAGQAAPAPEATEARNLLVSPPVFQLH